MVTFQEKQLPVISWDEITDQKFRDEIENNTQDELTCLN
jgi:hypothetical protein